MPVNELRLVLTVDDFEHATAFFRDALSLEQVAAWENDGGHAVLLDAGRASLEIFDQTQAWAIDEIEVRASIASASLSRDLHPPRGAIDFHRRRRDADGGSWTDRGGASWRCPQVRELRQRTAPADRYPCELKIHHRMARIAA